MGLLPFISSFLRVLRLFFFFLLRWLRHGTHWLKVRRCHWPAILTVTPPFFFINAGLLQEGAVCGLALLSRQGLLVASHGRCPLASTAPKASPWQSQQPSPPLAVRRKKEKKRKPPRSLFFLSVQEAQQFLDLFMPDERASEIAGLLVGGEHSVVLHKTLCRSRK